MNRLRPLRRSQPSPFALALSAAALALVTACAGSHGNGATDADHPLAGRIWDVSREKFIPEEDLYRILAAARYVLLGEVHDNPLHHRLEARVLAQLGAAGRRPAVVFEMIPRDRAAALQAALASPAPTAAEVRRAVDWDASGWPAWELYAPVFESALAAGLPLAAGDLAESDRKALRREGIAGLDPAAVASLGLDAPLPAAVTAVLDASIREGHCDLLPEAAVPAMVAFQRARDAQLARALADAAGADGAVLIAGAGHAQRDAGVPYHLARLDPGAAVVSVGLVEVRADYTDPRRDMAERFGGPAPFDFVWFTPATAREDPCELLKRELDERGQAPVRRRPPRHVPPAIPEIFPESAMMSRLDSAPAANAAAPSTATRGAPA